MDSVSDTTDEEYLTKSKTKGFRKTSPLSEPEINLKCAVCKNVFKTKEALKKHVTIHDKDGDWTCQKCSYQTNIESNLENHIRSAHSDIQSKEHKQKGSLTPEEKSSPKDLGENKTTCKRCSKTFIYKIDLN